ncbi:MAG: D-glycero-beta-D-manno-heptose 1,7-bisphosphate 7-phosphatase [Gammaproteobacteria bacterium]|nr:D-glycero-beta-D-manno-heptose 1,7-bisphosphate 7-phosphatase [Gammaproteobacteria bacterium]
MTAIILDRDGVINYDSDHYIKSPDEWHPIPGSLNAIAELNRAGFKIYVATNQSGISRGLYTLDTLALIHAKLHDALSPLGGKIEEIFFCPHHPDLKCYCRKPNPGMLFEIRNKHHLKLEETYFVGDTITDIKAALTAGCKPLLVLTGNGKTTLTKHPEYASIPYFEDLASVASHVISSKNAS